MTIKISYPKKLEKWVFTKKRYKGLKGGRGSGKSWAAGNYVVAKIMTNPDLFIVCIREIQKALKYSAKKLLEDTIRSLKLSHYFDITNTEIKRKNGLGKIVFTGMQDHTADSIKSLEGVDLVWIEEAQSISKHSMELLIPTIRKDDAELIFTWNPILEDNPVELLFNDNPDSICEFINYEDNPFCPQVLINEAERLREKDPELYAHIWLGDFRNVSDAIVFSKYYVVKEFEPQWDWNGPYLGADFGFSQDPTAAVECWINNNNLYIYLEAGKVGLEIDDTPAYISERIPNFKKNNSRWDNARPESISLIKRYGLPLARPCEKGKGSVEDGIEHMKSYDNIFIHPNCKETIREFRLYSYKIDSMSGDILPLLRIIIPLLPDCVI